MKINNDLPRTTLNQSLDRVDKYSPCRARLSCSKSTSCARAAAGKFERKRSFSVLRGARSSPRGSHAAAHVSSYTIDKNTCAERISRRRPAARVFSHVNDDIRFSCARRTNGRDNNTRTHAMVTATKSERRRGNRNENKWKRWFDFKKRNIDSAAVLSREVGGEGVRAFPKIGSQ